jgi:hypothetical protein
MESSKKLERLDRERDELLAKEDDKIYPNPHTRSIRRAIEKHYGHVIRIGPWDRDLDYFPEVAYRYALGRNINGYVMRHVRFWFLYGVIECPLSEVQLLHTIIHKRAGQVQVKENQIIFFELSNTPLRWYDSLIHYQCTKYYDHLYYRDKLYQIFKEYAQIKDEILRNHLNRPQTL